MSGFAAKSANRPPNIFTGVVFEVYPSTATCDVTVDFPDNRFYEAVPYASAFKDNGLAGFDFVPTRGCTVLLLEHPSHESSGAYASPIILGFMSPPGKAIGSRKELLPSDVQVQGKYGNQLLLRSNGDAYLVGDGQNLIAFILGEELTKLRTANFVHEHPGGGVKWVVDSSHLGGAVAYLHGIKRSASDQEPYLSVAAGASAAGGIDITMYDLSGKGSSDNPLFINSVPAGCAFRVNVDVEGNTAITSTGRVSVETVGDIDVSSLAAISLAAPQFLLSCGVGGLSVTGGVGEPLRISVPAGIDVVTPSIRIVQDADGLVYSDDTAESKELLNIDLMSWLKNHIHFVPTDPASTMAISTIPIATEVSAADPGIAAAKAGVDAGAAGGQPTAVAIQQAYISNENDYTIDESTGRTTDTKAR